MPPFGQSFGGQLLAAAVPIAANYVSTNLSNRQARNYAVDMAMQQRGWAIQDRDYENNYNSPASQMARLKAAGLNPNNLNGNTTAGGTSTKTRDTTAGSYRPDVYRMPETVVSNAFMAAADLKQKEVQTDNIAAMTRNANQDFILKGLQQSKIIADTAKTTVDTEQARANLGQYIQLAGTQLEAAKLAVEQQKQNIQFTSDANERANTMQSSNLLTAVYDRANKAAQTTNTKASTEQIRQTTENLKRTGILQQVEIDLAKLDLRPGDPVYTKVIRKAADKVLEYTGTKYIFEKGSEASKKLLEEIRSIYHNVNNFKKALNR